MTNIKHPDLFPLLRATYYPILLTLIMWAVWIIETFWSLDFAKYGLFPLKAEGLPGILLSPFIHKDFDHIVSNTFPFIFLGWSLFYFYRDIAWKVLTLIYLTTGLWVWFMARPAFHIGASGVVYGLVSFLFISGILRRDTRLLAVTFIVTFLYGSVIWGVFPDLFPYRNISWESHLMGLLSGFIWGIYFKNQGPERKLYSWELEDEEDEPGKTILSAENSENESVEPSPPVQPDPGMKIVYHFRSDSSEEMKN